MSLAACVCPAKETSVKVVFPFCATVNCPLAPNATLLCPAKGVVGVPKAPSTLQAPVPVVLIPLALIIPGTVRSPVCLLNVKPTSPPKTPLSLNCTSVVAPPGGAPPPPPVPQVPQFNPVACVESASRHCPSVELT